jgi:hypothetical protein
MRTFSTLIIAAAFVLSGKNKKSKRYIMIIVLIDYLFIANAASLGKRAISAPVQLCIDDINSVAAQVTIVKTDVSI